MWVLIIGAVFLFATASVQAEPLDAGMKWVAPTKRTDGRPLTISELSHYEVTYRSGVLPEILIGKPKATDTVFNGVVNVPAGTYDLMIRAVDLNGLRSTPAIKMIIIEDIIQAPVAPTILSVDIKCEGNCSVKVVGQDN